MSDVRLSVDWGDVPDDGELRAFSKLTPNRGATNRRNKRHHHISVTYMKGFAGADDRAWAYHADAPGPPYRVRPETMGYENHYYSQKNPDGTLENHGF